MSYTALYRKFRPDCFEDVKGQDHIVTTLKNQILADRIGHAYLFCGTRGTGKTTIAKLFAKAVNCEHPKEDGSPCGACKSCLAVQAGASMNVIEIDAASNNGVDNIREIRDEVQYSPTEGRYKVYIIDEVHMLSIGAFNALLKTLEEPPSYVIFILATTEAHKIPITILSRCQRYDFKRISIQTIADRLMELMTMEQVNVEEKAIRYIAKAADGSLRDALSLLDQCLAFYMNQDLTYDKVLEVLGAVDTEVFSKLLRKIISDDTLGCIRQLEELIMSGRELSQFTVDFTWYMRNLLLVQTAENVEEVLDVSTENRMALEEEAKMIEPEVLMRYIRVFSELSGQIKYSSQKRVLTEIALIKLTKPSMETSYDSILNRLALIEKQLEEGVVAAADKTAGVGQINSAMSGGEGMKNSKEQSSINSEELQKAVPEEVQEAVNAMPEIIRTIGALLSNYLKMARFQAGGDNRLLVAVTDEIAEGYLNTQERRERLGTVISNTIGKAIQVDIKLIREEDKNESIFLTAQKNIDMDIQEEE